MNPARGVAVLVLVIGCIAYSTGSQDQDMDVQKRALLGLLREADEDMDVQKRGLLDGLGLGKEAGEDMDVQKRGLLDGLGLGREARGLGILGLKRDFELKKRSGGHGADFEERKKRSGGHDADLDLNERRKRLLGIL